MKEYRNYWKIFLFVLIVCFTILGFFGKEVYRQAPPIPLSVESNTGKILYTKDNILNGQLAWQSVGGQQLGSILGHGAYQAPDWTADWLHREILIWRENFSIDTFLKPYADLTTMEKAQADTSLIADYKENTYNNKTGTLVLSGQRIKAIQETGQYYLKLFGDHESLRSTRESYAMHENVMPDETRRTNLNAFFFWTSWSAATHRPDANITYTNNWPHEPLINNVPSSSNILWSIISVIILLIALGALVWYWAFKKKEDGDDALITPKEDPLNSFTITSSQKALWKYLFTIVGLFVLQVALGAILAHYSVEGQDFYGIPLSKWLPYSLARTWHIQTALFWIATAFLAAGLFLAPIINGGKDPKHQTLGVNILWGALVVVVLGSLTGEALAIHQVLSLDWSFLVGIQGYEYTDLGRIWQIALLIGLLLWLGLMLRAIIPALKKDTDKSLLVLFAGAATAIGLFYAAGLFYGAKTNLTIMEYWRWWVVHLWVEGFFEVFATVAIAFLFQNLGLISKKIATRGTLASASIFLLGGIPGTFHHLYFSGTPAPIMAVGACFSALEVVPLILIGFEAKENWARQNQSKWMNRYRWPIMFFTGVAFWNLVGAGIFGFLINPPISLYYVQGLNLTPVHAHAATFGVYGLLSLGLVLFILRRIKPEGEWDTRWIKRSFWLLNFGLGLMILLSLLPIGLLQAWESIQHGLWSARSEEFMNSKRIETLRWLRIIGDTIFIAGTACFAYFLFGVARGFLILHPSTKQNIKTDQPTTESGRLIKI